MQCSSPPDLACTAEGSLRITDTKILLDDVLISNLGGSRTDDFYVAYLLSDDVSIDNEDILLGISSLEGIAANTYTNLSFEKDIRELNLEAGSYYIGIWVDYETAISEISEENNTCYFDEPKLRVPSNNRQANLQCGDLGQLKITDNLLSVSALEVKNNGTATASAGTIGFFLSEDTVISQTDLFIGTKIFQSLAAGQKIAIDFSASLENLSSATYYLGVIIDLNQTIDETNEGNDNSCYYNTPIIIMPPPVQQANLSCFSTGNLRIQNNELQLSDLKIVNNGNAPALQPNIAYYLSEDEVIDNNDLKLGESNVQGAITVGSIRYLSFTTDIGNLPAGNYHFGIIIDPANAIVEQSEADNDCIHPEKVNIVETETTDCRCTSPYATNFCDDFESYDLGEIGLQSFCWTTWSGVNGGEQEGVVQGNRTNKYLRIWEGGVQNVILLLGNRMSGKYELAFDFFVPIGASAYYSVLHNYSPDKENVERAFNIYFNSNGQGQGQIGNRAYPFQYPYNKWLRIKHHFDLDNDEVLVFIDDNLVFQQAFSLIAGRAANGIKQLGAINFHPIDATYRFFIDKVYFEKVAAF